MGYYCTVPQCTSLAGKTKNVKFHRFPRDVTMADKWNNILKRGKPYTKYSKVCSLHFTQADYNVTTMGQWKTLSKDAVPSQNLPKLNPDGTVMVIRKSRTVKYKEGHVKKESDRDCEKLEDKWSHSIGTSTGVHSSVHTHASSLAHSHGPGTHAPVNDAVLPYRLPINSIATLAPSSAPQLNGNSSKPDKQDAIMQTDPQSEEDEKQNSNYSDNSLNDVEVDPYPNNVQSYPAEPRNPDYEIPKDYTKNNEDYLPQTNEEYNKEAEKYALERKSHFDKTENGYKTVLGYQKIQDMYETGYNRDYQDKNADYQRTYDPYQNGFTDSAQLLRNQQHNLQILQEQHRSSENQNFFNENHIKQEMDLNAEDEKYLYERSKEALEANSMYEQQRIMQQRLLEHVQQQVKSEPDTSGGDNVMQPQGSPYYPPNGHNNVASGYYNQLRAPPGPELLIAKQNALAAHTQLWQNSMKRPFIYSESPHYNGSQIIQRYEDLTRMLQ